MTLNCSYFTSIAGQYHQPLSDVQKAHQRLLQAPKSQHPPNHHQSKSLGRSSGAQFFNNAINSATIDRVRPNSAYPSDQKRHFGSIGRQNGAIWAPRTPLMGRQIRERRHMQMQQPQRPKSR